MSLLPNTLKVPPITIGTRLRVAREWRDMDQAQIAEGLGLTRQTVSNYERGYTLPGKLVINAWAVICDVDVDWLRTGVEPEVPSGPEGGPSNSTEVIG